MSDGIPPVPSFLTARSIVVVSVNGVLVGLNRVADAIKRFCQPALFHDEFADVFDIAASGSAILLRYRARNIVLCTRHQFRASGAINRPESFTIALDEGGSKRIGLNPNRVSRLEYHKEEHANLGDLFIAEFEDQRGARNLRGRFLEVDLHTRLDNTPQEELTLLLSIGFPTEARSSDMTTDDEGMPIAWAFDIRWIKLYLVLSAPKLMDTENRLMMTKHDNQTHDLADPDGMSGAPVFFVATKNNIPRLGFAGMITDAREGRFAVYPALDIKRALDHYIDGDAQADT